MECSESEIRNSYGMIECPHCRHKIPEHNVQLHEVTCNIRCGFNDKRTDNNGARQDVVDRVCDASSMEQSPAYVDLVSHDDMDVTDEGEAHLSSSNNANPGIELVGRAPATTGRSEGQAVSTEEWACPRCTLLNPSSSTQCDACHFVVSREQSFQHIRSPDATRRERLVIDLTESPHPERTTASAGTCESDRPNITSTRQQGILLAGGALIGSVFGGASALLQGQRLDQGFLNGAATGAATGVILNELLRPQHSEQGHRNQSSLSVSAQQLQVDGANGSSTSSVAASRTTNNAADNGARPAMAAPEVAHPTVVAPPVLVLPLTANSTRVVTIGPARISFFTNGRGGVDAQAQEMFVRNMMSSIGSGTGLPSYEQLLEMFGDGMENRGADAALINRLPVSSVENPELLPEDCRACAVCLSNYEKGDERKLLPCLHGFHKDCIDTWLSRNATCPVCKFELKDH